MTAGWDPAAEETPPRPDLRTDSQLFTELAAECLVVAARELQVPVNTKRRVPVNGASYTISEASGRAVALAAVAAAATELARWYGADQ